MVKTNPQSYMSYGEKFREAFPDYLAMGMTEEQYWDKDPQLAKYYREAEEIRANLRNQSAWLHGLYVYDAILCASPILHDFAKRGTKPKPYPEQPYALTAKDRKKADKDKEHAAYAKGKNYMLTAMAKINSKFNKKEKGVKTDG